jgi:hypothetical protein
MRKAWVSLPAETWLGLFEKQGLSIEHAAQRAGVGRSTLSKALRGQEARQAGWWTSLGAAFGLSVEQSVALCDPSHERGWVRDVEGEGLTVGRGTPGRCRAAPILLAFAVSLELLNVPARVAIDSQLCRSVLRSE